MDSIFLVLNKAAASIGVNLNSTGQVNKVPLHVAAKNGRTMTIKLLLDYGCDLEAVTFNHLCTWQFSRLGRCHTHPFSEYCQRAHQRFSWKYPFTHQHNRKRQTMDQRCPYSEECEH